MNEQKDLSAFSDEEILKEWNVRKSKIGSTEEKKMHPGTCSDCGRDTEVPFKPKPGLPIYCRECYFKRREEK